MWSSKRKIIFTIIIIFGLCSRIFGQSDNRLEKIYSQKSFEKLKIYLDQWAIETKPIDAKEILKQKGYVKASYAIFEAIFDPHNIGKLGVKQIRYEIYRKYHYFIIPTKIYIYTSGKVYYDEEEMAAYAINAINKIAGPDSLKSLLIDRIKNRYNYYQQTINSFGPYGYLYKDSSLKLIDSLINFRPNVTQAIGIPLYLTKKYELEILDFLGTTSKPFAAGGLENISEASGESANRQNFLERFVKVAHGHWGGYWDLKTPPSIYAITFDKEFKYAKVDFNLVYEGGSVFLKFEEGNWQFMSAKRTWQE